MLKRCFDFCFALCVLLLLWPVMLAIAVWIKLDSRGPVIFRQIRVGRSERPFVVLKFRSMYVGPSQPPSLAVGVDRRITSAGRIIRRYKLDELPQFVNVLKGQMSVVGPRPELPQYVAMYPPVMRRTVLSVRPGITDFASLVYRNEGALLTQCADPEVRYLSEILPAKLALCERYVREQSLLMDLKIIGRTMAVVFRP